MLVEHMNEHFVKYHAEGLPFPAVFHKFSAPDQGDPHDHPWSFQTHILKGGYVEEIYQFDKKGWFRSIAKRLPGTSHVVKATTVHRIVELLEPECWTLILPGPYEKKSGFWRFGDDVQFRYWDEQDYRVPESLRSSRS